MTTGSSFGALDAEILRALDADPSLSVLGLSRVLGVSRNTVHAHLRRLEVSGALGDVSRRLDPSAMGYDLTAFVQISISQSAADEVFVGLAAIPEVVEVHSTTGDADLMAKVVARDAAGLRDVTAHIHSVDGVVRTSTVVSLGEVVAYRMSGLLDRARSTAD